MKLVKLGGSVLTVKGGSHYREPRRRDIARFARELAPAAPGFALIHGAGSFGHTLAEKHQLRGGYVDDTQLLAAAQVHRDVRELNGLVIAALIRAGVPAVSVAASDVLRFQDSAPDRFHGNPFTENLELGLVPVTFGDVVRDSRRGFTIASGDDLFVHLAAELRPELSVSVTAEDGVFTANPKKARGAKLLDQVDATMLEKIDFKSFGGGDVTGTMREKLRKMLEVAKHSKRTLIVGGRPGRLASALAGKPVPGTEVVA
jgi:isopentenyl phosphate kinase